MSRFRTALQNLRLRRQRAASRQASFFQNADFREWLNVAATVGTVLIGVIGLWNTARISGLEDYFRSEIVRRNKEITIQAARASRLETEVSNRERLLSDLEARVETLFIRSLEQTDILRQSQADLQRSQFKIFSADRELSGLREASGSLSRENDRQLHYIDILRKRRAYEFLSFRILFFDREELVGHKSGPAHTIRMGETLYEGIRSTEAPPDDLDLSPYIERIKTNMPKACPSVLTRAFFVPDIPDRPTPGPVDYTGAKGPEEITARFNAKMAEFNVRYEAYGKLTTGVGDDYLKQLRTFWDDAAICICASLADEQIGQHEICPSRK